MSHLHVTDFAAYALASAGAATAILPPDFAALGVAAIGGIIGGFLSVAVVPEASTETRRSVGLKWAVSSLSSIAVTPALFQYLSSPKVNEAGVHFAAVIHNTAESMLALSTGVAFVAWITLRLGQEAYIRWVASKLPAAPPKRRRGEQE